MDPAGAEQLRLRIEQQAHWRRADAVNDGRQPPTDPDRADLEEIDEGLRLYRPRITHGVLTRPCKHLVNGVWESGTITEPAQSPERSGSSPEPETDPAKVASYA